MIKKVILLIGIIAIITALPVYAQGEAVSISERPTGGRAGIIGDGVDVGDEFVFTSFYDASETKTLSETLEEGMLAHNTVIDIRKYAIPNTNAGKMELLDVLSEVIHANYNIVCFTGYNHNYSGGIITAVKPYYILSSYEDDVAARAEMDAKIDEYIELASDALDFIGKMVVIHDELAKTCRYSTAELAEFDRKMEIRNEYIDAGKSLSLIPEEDRLTAEDFSIYTPFRLLTKGDAVCQGNSIAINAIYKRLAEECGQTDFDSAFCYNTTHIWNMIKLGGEWYHLDETWNDPDIRTRDADGNIVLADKCLHDYFMVSDGMMQNHAPEEWEYYCYDGNGITCDDTRYESGHIFNGKNEYGGWYGNIAYQNGRYKVDVWALQQYDDTTQNVVYAIKGYPMFYSNTAKSHGLIASDAFKVTVSGSIKNRVVLFANEEIEAGTNIRYALYEGNELLDIVVDSTLGKGEEAKHVILTFSPVANKGKVLLWKNGTQQPLCEAMEIK